MISMDNVIVKKNIKKPVERTEKQVEHLIRRRKQMSKKVQNEYFHLDDVAENVSPIEINYVR